MTPKTEGAGKLELFERQYKERYDEIDKGGIVPMEDFFVADRVVMSLIEEARASERERCVKLIKRLKTPYPSDLLGSKILPTKKEQTAWKFGDLVFNNTKNDIIEILIEEDEDSPKPRKGFGIDVIKNLK